MRIYVAHKRREEDSEFYSVFADLDHEFILPHKDSATLFNSKELFQNKGCELVLAEVSEPATGLGIELGWADMLNIPIVCIYKPGSKLSNSLNAVSDRFVEYIDYPDLKTKLKEVLK